jgi:hypothetical protein
MLRKVGWLLQFCKKKEKRRLDIKTFLLETGTRRINWTQPCKNFQTISRNKLECFWLTKH